MPERSRATVAVLGASGLIGQAIAEGLAREGVSVVPIARRFNRAQKSAFGATAVSCPVVEADAATLSRIIVQKQINVIVNCIGVLQDRSGAGTDPVHRTFAQRLIDSIGSNGQRVLLVQLSIPGGAEHDKTAFSRSKRAADNLIAAAAVPFVILRPGFVVASAAYGGGALIRALATLPFDLPETEAGRPFATTAISDIVRTVAILVRRWSMGEENWREVWDVMSPQSTTVGDVVNALRSRFGGPAPRWRAPSWLLRSTALAGDCAGYFGWQPPLCTTALKELQRGIQGDPTTWMQATAMDPVSLESALQRLPATAQEKWFARLYLLKALVVLSLVLFWIASGVVGLAAFPAASEILTSHGLSTNAARIVALTGCLADVAIGLAIAFRTTCQVGLLAGIGVSTGYMIGAALIAPELWAEPLGALVKTGPAVVLMIMALAILESR